MPTRVDQRHPATLEDRQARGWRPETVMLQGNITCFVNQLRRG